MKKILLIAFMSIQCFTAAAQKTLRDPFSPLPGFDTAFHEIKAALIRQHYVITQIDSMAGTLMAYKSVDGTDENQVLLSMHVKKFDSDEMFIMVFEKKGKVKEKLEDVRDRLHEDFQMALTPMAKV